MSLKAQAFTGGNLFIEGFGLFGEVVDVELPKIENEIIETSSGVGKMEAILPTIKPLSVKITVNNLNWYYFNMLDTSRSHYFYLKANASNSDGKDTQIVASFRGKLKNMDGAKFEFNKEANLSFEASLSFYKLEVGNLPVILYDAINNVYEAGGVDLFENIRKNIL
ncbi:MAG: phage major tail tube protein [Campylobacter sp.]